MHTEFLSEDLKERYHLVVVSVNCKTVLKIILKVKGTLDSSCSYWGPIVTPVNIVMSCSIKCKECVGYLNGC
jgi:hypothetical protein